jgi:hypothetical protein
MSKPEFKANKEQKKAIYELAKSGCSDAEIAEAIGIHRHTFAKHKYTYFDELKKGREEGEPINISNVENALLKKALGFEYIEITREPHWAKQDGYIGIEKDKGMMVTKEVTKMVIPSDQAIFYYLGNRAADRWKSVNYQKIENELGPDAAEFFKQIADAIERTDTATD